MIFYDFEVTKYDWLVVAIDPVKQCVYRVHNSKSDLEKLYREYKKDIWVGYNSRAYDQWILKAILCGFNPKEVNDFIIVKGRKGHEFSSLFYKIKLNNYDTMPNIPVSLKALEGFMGASIIETSVPFDIDRPLTSEEVEDMFHYCEYDVLKTIDVFLERKTEFDSHMGLLKTFNLPLEYIGKTQAQLAAIILGATKQKFNDEWDIRVPDTLRLTKYAFIADWFLNPENQDYEKKLEVNIAGVPHTVAWGGLHGAISKYSYRCNKDEVFIMADVDQLYPTLMIVYRLLSRAVKDYGKFENILKTSLRLKAEKKKKEREPYKRICNITYGAEGDMFNAMYDPLHRNLVCVFGQLLVIDLIEKLEGVCELIQANTDGILVKLKRKDVERFKAIVHDWEQRTQLHMGYDEYTCVYQGDVNNYVIISEDGSHKSKGAYVKELNNLDYDMAIVNEAITMNLVKGTPVEQTIYECNDMRKFQKIVKLSSKYKWVEHEQGRLTKKYDNKAYRVFASNNTFDGRLLKCDGVRNPAKFGNTPDHCFTFNHAFKEVQFPTYKLNRQYYVDLAKKRLKEKFGVIV